MNVPFSQGKRCICKDIYYFKSFQNGDHFNVFLTWGDRTFFHFLRDRDRNNDARIFIFSLVVGYGTRTKPLENQKL